MSVLSNENSTHGTRCTGGGALPSSCLINHMADGATHHRALEHTQLSDRRAYLLAVMVQVVRHPHRQSRDACSIQRVYLLVQDVDAVQQHRAEEGVLLDQLHCHCKVEH